MVSIARARRVVPVQWRSVPPKARPSLARAEQATIWRRWRTAESPAEDAVPVTWLPVHPGLTPQGLRHRHQTGMEEAGISDLLRSERMGYEVSDMRASTAMSPRPCAPDSRPLHGAQVRATVGAVDVQVLRAARVGLTLWLMC